MEWYLGFGILYLVLSGSVEVVQEGPDGERTVLRRQAAGEFFGELGVAHGQARTAHVISAEAVTCLVFSRRPDSAWAGRGAPSPPDALSDDGYEPDSAAVQPPKNSF